MATNFREGDTVKMVMIDTRWHDYVDDLAQFLGSTGTIIVKNSMYNDVDECRNVLVRFNYDARGSREWYVDPNWLEMVKPAPRGWNGKVVCTGRRDGTLEFFTVGKVYNVVDGKLYADYTIGAGCYANGLKNFDELVRDTKDYYDFIEFKGFANS